MRCPKSFFRILIVLVTTAGKAIGLLKRDRGNVNAGIMLDHDLQQQTATESDCYLSGGDVVEAVIRYISNDIPVLVHSMNLWEDLQDG